MSIIFSAQIGVTSSDVSTREQTTTPDGTSAIIAGFSQSQTLDGLFGAISLLYVAPAPITFATIAFTPSITVAVDKVNYNTLTIARMGPGPLPSTILLLQVSTSNFPWTAGVTIGLVSAIGSVSLAANEGLLAIASIDGLPTSHAAALWGAVAGVV